MDEGSRIYRPRCNLPMHTTIVLCYPGTGRCSTRDECLGTAGDHGGQSCRWRVWIGMDMRIQGFGACAECMADAEYTAVGEEQQVKESMHKSPRMSARGAWRLGEPRISPDPPRSVHP